jgi:hypothetical protein
MYNVSSAFNAAATANARQILARAYVNDVLLTGEDLIDMTITEAASASAGLSMGTTISSKLTARIKMPETPIALSGSIIRPEVSFYGVDEWVPLGKFYITDAVSDSNFNVTFTITAYDSFCKTEEPYTPRIDMPNTAEAILNDIASQYGFAINSISGYFGLPKADGDGVLKYSPLPAIDSDGVLTFEEEIATSNTGVLAPRGSAESLSEYDLLDLTCRQYIGYFAGLLGCYARFDRNGELVFAWYSDHGYNISQDQQYMNGFERLTEGDFSVRSITSGTSGDMFTSGSGVGFSFENPFMTQNILDSIFNGIGNISYTPAKIKWRGNPAVEVGDIIIADDYGGTSRRIYIMEQTIQISGGLSSEIKCYGESEEAIQFSTSPQAKKLQQVYNKLQTAIAEATKLLNGANGGVFEILDENGDGVNDGWIIHSGDGQRFIKANLNGIGITKNGGATYEQAMTVNGINADVITTGQMNAERITVGDSSLGDVFSVDLDDEGHPVVTIGSSASNIKQKQTNDAVTFVDGDVEVAKFSTTGAEWADLQQMKYCGFIWTKSSTSGNVRFTKVGEN